MSAEIYKRVFISGWNLVACETEVCRHLQNGLAEKIQKSRKQMKERKNRARKVRGVKKNAGGFSGPPDDYSLSSLLRNALYMCVPVCGGYVCMLLPVLFVVWGGMEFYH